MKSLIAKIVVALVIFVIDLGVNAVFRHQTSTKRNFDPEIQAALESAKTAAGFEHLGTLVHICLLPQSGGENATDTMPRYITDPKAASARDTWFAGPAKVFDNLYFVVGKLHSA